MCFIPEIYQTSEAFISQSYEGSCINCLSSLLESQRILMCATPYYFIKLLQPLTMDTGTTVLFLVFQRIAITLLTHLTLE